MKLLKLIIAYFRSYSHRVALRWASVPLNRKRPSLLRQTLPLRENRRLTDEEQTRLKALAASVLHQGLAARNFDDNDA